VTRHLCAILAVIIGLLSSACNRTEPEPASADLPFAQLELTIVRTATDLFLQRFNLTLKVQGHGKNGCTSTTELFPDTGYAGRRNVYLAGKGLIYVVGQFDARVINPHDCKAALSEFRHLDRHVVFLGSFDQNSEKRWVYFPAAERPELPFEKR